MLSALEKDPLRFSSVMVAMNSHKRLLRVDSKLAEQYKRAAQKVFIYSIYFEGASKDIQ